jgi:hypothetical protein
MRATIATLLALSLALAGCGEGDPPGDGGLDLEAVPHANGGCEKPSAAALETGAEMLPGRICNDCHKEGGQAASAFTAAGTVYGGPAGACDEPGLAGVDVEILDENGAVAMTLTTNEVGNFSTSAEIPRPMRVRLRQGDKTAVMTSTAHSGSCATCHRSEPEAGAPGRVYLE